MFRDIALLLFLNKFILVFLKMLMSDHEEEAIMFKVEVASVVENNILTVFRGVSRLFEDPSN